MGPEWSWPLPHTCSLGRPKALTQAPLGPPPGLLQGRPGRPLHVCPQAQAGPWTVFSSLLQFSLTSRSPDEIALRPGSHPTESARNTRRAFKLPEKKDTSPRGCEAERDTFLVH